MGKGWCTFNVTNAERLVSNFSNNVLGSIASQKSNSFQRLRKIDISTSAPCSCQNAKRSKKNVSKLDHQDLNTVASRR